MAEKHALKASANKKGNKPEQGQVLVHPGPGSLESLVDILPGADDKKVYRELSVQSGSKNNRLSFNFNEACVNSETLLLGRFPAICFTNITFVPAFK